ncbi:MAG: extracellular solute-binding protein [Eisenbergiella sp.]
MESREGAAIDEVIAAFEEKYPNIKVNHVYMPYTDHVEKLKIDLASGEGADVFGMQTGATIKEFRDFEMDLTSCGRVLGRLEGSAWTSVWIF